MSDQLHALVDEWRLSAWAAKNELTTQLHKRGYPPDVIAHETAILAEREFIFSLCSAQLAAVIRRKD